VARRLALVCLTVLAAGGPVSAAFADGDPGSDVLVYQHLFVEADAGVPLSQQATLGALLAEAQRDAFPVRVAVVASRYDLGAITGLWRRPRLYARFLGLELSQAYTGRLLVVMPNGLGFNWPGHPAAPAYRTLGRISVAPGGRGLAGAAQAAVVALAAQAGVRLAPPSATTGGSGHQSGAPAGVQPASGSNLDSLVAIVSVAIVALVVLLVAVRRLSRRPVGLAIRRRLGQHRQALAITGAGLLAASAAIAGVALIGRSSVGPAESLAANPALDPGQPISGPAPSFDLTDQFGQPVSLREFRGKVVLLAFNDSECTTICPLTTTAMLDAKAMLGSAGNRVQLLGIDANPKATSLEDVLSYSQLHGMLLAWHFLTGSLPQLRRVWRAYHIEAAVQAGEIAHTPALFVIDRGGRMSRLFLTQQSYAAVGQLGQLLAQAASRLLPGLPAVHARYRYSQITGISPSTPTALPRAGAGSIRLAPGHARLLLFFATWDRQITGLAAGLTALGRYGAAAARLGLPPLVGIDEGSVEPPGALGAFLSTLPRPLSYPIAVDRDGQVADGYEVEGLPWLMVVSPSGRIAWFYSVAALGWPSTQALIARVREALARASAAPGTLGSALAQLRGSPPALAGLHRQASKLLGGESLLAARVRALRGYPVVINAWASWCGPCRAEFTLLASAAALYGRRVAFLGVDTGDSAGDARSFLAQHPVSYPSYQSTTTGLDSLVPQGLAGLPTTLFLNRQGRLVYVHTGQYESQGTLDADVQSYAH
jgi:cytochrome oxidase Cu insertion factor (SCO1/SenC/PrrC family)/thiol-disulfide isomerase/thioredoxin